MFYHLNESERKVLVGLVILLISGTAIDALFHRYPPIFRAASFIDRPASYPVLDINRATRQELEALPYIGPYTAGAILDYRARHKAFRFVDELRKIPGIRPENFKHFRDYLEVKP